MRLLVATHSFDGNGAAVILQNLLLALRTRFGVTVDVIHGGEGALCGELRAAGVRFLSTADCADYDVALVNTMLDGDWVARLSPHLPTIFWVHEGRAILWGRDEAVRRAAEPFHLATRVVFQCRWQADTVFASLLAGLPSERVEILPCGLPPRPRPTAPIARHAGRGRVLFTGALNPRKRPDDIVAAMEAWGRDDIELVLIGDTRDAGRLTGMPATMASRPDRYRVLGERSRAQVMAWMTASDVFCLPSWDETQGLAALEAADCGVPPVLSDLPAYHGIWKHGENALLFPVGATDVLRWNLRALIEDASLRRRLGLAARETARRFAFTDFVTRFTVLLEAAAARR